VSFEELLKFVFVGGLVVIPTVWAILTCVRLRGNQPRWLAYVCLGGFLVGVSAAIPIAQNVAAGAAAEPERWWAVVGLITTFGGSVVALLALLATRKWTQNARLSQTVISIWVVITLLIGMAFVPSSGKNRPVIIPAKTKHG
jgi:hypothetical protein